jgi:predicted Zn-dependent protease
MRRVDGLMYGDNPDQGLVRGSQMRHRSLRFVVDFPDGWEVQNGATQVVAKAPNVNAFVLLEVVEKPAGRTIQDIALNAMQQAGFQAVSGNRTRVNGLDAFVGTYQGQMQNLGNVGLHAAHIVHGDRVFMLAGLAPAAEYRSIERTLDRSVRSFRPLSQAEADAIQPDRIDLYVARAGDTWQSLAERSGGRVKATTLAAMNGHRASEPPREGERLKIVVPG